MDPLTQIIPPSTATAGAARRVAVVTRCDRGIGRWIALGLARAGYALVLIARDKARADATRSWIAGACAADAAGTADRRSLVARRDARGGCNHCCATPRNRLLINNAGIFETRQTFTAEGVERVVATNLLSPFVLTRQLLPSLRAGAPSRIVNIGSSTSDRARIDPDDLGLAKHWTMVRAYGQSKLALMMVTFALAERLAGSGVVANVVHPGLVATGLVRSGGIIGLAWRCLALAALSEEQGADTPLHAALAPELASVSGAYFKNRRIATPNRLAADRALVERVWAATERLAAPVAAPS